MESILSINRNLFLGRVSSEGGRLRPTAPHPRLSQRVRPGVGRLTDVGDGVGGGRRGGLDDRVRQPDAADGEAVDAEGGQAVGRHVGDEVDVAGLGVDAADDTIAKTLKKNN